MNEASKKEEKVQSIKQAAVERTQGQKQLEHLIDNFKMATEIFAEMKQECSLALPDEQVVHEFAGRLVIRTFGQNDAELTQILSEKLNMDPMMAGELCKLFRE